MEQTNDEDIFKDVSYMRIVRRVSVTYDKIDGHTSDIAYRLIETGDGNKDLREAELKKIDDLGIEENIDQMIESSSKTTALHTQKLLKNAVSDLCDGEPRLPMYDFKGVSKFSFEFEFRVTIAYDPNFKIGGYAICSVIDEYNKKEGTLKARSRLYSAMRRRMNGTAGQKYRIKGAFEFGATNGLVHGSVER